MKKNPTISVLMPAYNAEKYIEEAINSILNQSFRDFELVITDDYSTDKTWGIIQKFAKKDKRIRAYRNDKNLYIAENRNKLLILAKGKYIAWQDADDISFPERLKRQYVFLEKHPDAGIVGGYLQFFNDRGITGIRKYAIIDQDLRKNIFRFSPVAQPGAMIRKDCFNKVGFYNPTYPPAEDIDMSFRIGKLFKFANLDEVVIKYRENLNSATYKRLKTIEINTLKIRFKNAFSKSYKPSFIDIVYNFLQLLSIFLIPPKIKIWVFNRIRNTTA